MQKRLLGGYLFIIIILFNSGCSQFKEYKHVFILELSIPDLMISLSEESNNSDFRSAISDAKEAQLTSSDDFITLFAEAWHTQVAYQENPTPLWWIFHNMEQKNLFPAMSTDEEIIEILASEAKDAINNTESIITTRILNNYTYQNRINYKINQLPNYKLEIITSAIEDKNNFRKTLVSSGNLEFWPVLFNSEVYLKIIQAEIAYANSINPEFYGENAPADSTLTPEQLGSKYSIQSKIILLDPFRNRSNIVGHAHMDNREDILKTLNTPLIKKTIGDDVRFAWSSNPQDNNPQFYSLYALKDESIRGKAQLSGNSILDSGVSSDEFGNVSLDLTMDEEGTGIWKRMTHEFASQNYRSVAIVLDNLVLSAPSVSQVITNGRSQIFFGSSQTRSEKIEEAEDILGFLKSGSLPARCLILEEWEYEYYD